MQYIYTYVYHDHHLHIIWKCLSIYFPPPTTITADCTTDLLVGTRKVDSTGWLSSPILCCYSANNWKNLNACMFHKTDDITLSFCFAGDGFSRKKKERWFSLFQLRHHQLNHYPLSLLPVVVVEGDICIFAFHLHMQR